MLLKVHGEPLMELVKLTDFLTIHGHLYFDFYLGPYLLVLESYYCKTRKFQG